MAERPYTLLSVGMSIDGFVDAGTPERVRFSNDADFDRVDDVRAACDAILVGAATVRHDNPRLLVKDPARRRARVARGLRPSPTKVTLTTGGDLDAGSNFFTAGSSDKLVYCPSGVVGSTRARLGRVATVVDAGPRVDVRRLAEDVGDRGHQRLMVEGGGRVLTQFLAADLADELQLVVAPFFIGDPRAPRLVRSGPFPWTAERRARLAQVRPIGDVVLLRYALSPRFEDA
jgi:5-amino-6-(5-phosphoribosylamino)uracil reductase